MRRLVVRRLRFWLGMFAVPAWLTLFGVRLLHGQSEPPHPILTISGSGSGASAILSTWTESQYTNCFTPRLAPRNDGYGFVPPVVSGDTDWSWSISSPTQIVSTPSGTVFPTAAYSNKTQAVQVLSGNSVQKRMVHHPRADLS